MAGPYFSVPFATSGDKNDVPIALQPDGSISYTLGWGPNYEKADTDPGYLPVSREFTNGFNWAVTSAIKDLQDFGVPPYFAEAAPYAINALVRSSNKVWRSVITNNSSVPGSDANWVDLAAPPADATDTVKGIVELATPAEAVTGTDSVRAVTPQGLHAARMRRIARLSSATVQAVSGTNVSPQVYTPLSFTFTADGGLYEISAKIQLNANASTGTDPSNAIVVKLLNGATALDISAANISVPTWSGQVLVLKWSGVLSGAVNLTVTFEKTFAQPTSSLSVNGDRDDNTSNVSGQLSNLEIYRMGA